MRTPDPTQSLSRRPMIGIVLHEIDAINPKLGRHERAEVSAARRKRD
jgi:hypothetical protein